MLKKSTLNTQDEFIKYISENNVKVNIYLINGIKLSGIITSYDSYSIVLVKEEHSMLVYKHGIGTISPDDCIPVFQN